MRVMLEHGWENHDALRYDERIHRQARHMGTGPQMIELTNPLSRCQKCVVRFNSRHELCLPDLLKGVIKVSLPFLRSL